MRESPAEELALQPEPSPGHPQAADTQTGPPQFFEAMPADSFGTEHPHFDFPSRFFGIWHRPRASGVGREERCRPAPFRPRGYGHLFARRSTCYRLDYRPHVLKHPFSHYGPAYYRMHKDLRCECCGHCKHLGRCLHCGQDDRCRP